MEPIVTVFAHDTNTYFAYHYSETPQTELLNFVCQCFNALINQKIVTNPTAQLFCFCDSDQGFLVCIVTRVIQHTNFIHNGKVKNFSSHLTTFEIKNKFCSSTQTDPLYSLMSETYSNSPITIHAIDDTTSDITKNILKIIKSSKDFSIYEIFTSKPNPQ